MKKDGDVVTKGTVFGLVSGPAKALLIGERVALNIMQRMSGIASLTRAMVINTSSIVGVMLISRTASKPNAPALAPIFIFIFVYMPGSQKKCFASNSP